MPPNVIAVTGLAFEARIAAGPGVDVLCATERLRSLEWLEASTAYECSGIISFGIAGGLDRRLSPGDWVIASSVVTDTGQFPADPSWARRLLSMVPGSIHAAISPRSLRAEPEMFRRTSATIAALDARAFFLG